MYENFDTNSMIFKIDRMMGILVGTINLVELKNE